ncbi:MAG TPA: C4-type zinc ribbon domain-containing protein [Thermoanaerobaculia bacterium]|nr:C4-type zinc ribbon domain-containing protein [Thermoanaerobaculia bacterium]
MKDVVERLWQLQTAITELTEKEKNLDTRPEDFAEVHDEWERMDREMQALRERLEVGAKERRRIEGELQDQQELLKKYQGQLMQVKNQQQYAAAWKEIDGTRKGVKDLEESLLARMTEIEQIQSEIDERQAGHDGLKARYDEEHAKWQASLGDLRGEIKSIRKRIVEIESGIPDRYKAEFHRILKQRQGVAVAPVIDGACSACRVRVRPQAAQQLKRGELIFCEGCRRFSYLESHAS